MALQHYKKLLELFESEGDVAAYIRSISEEDVVRVLEYLVKIKRTKDRSIAVAEQNRP